MLKHQVTPRAHSPRRPYCQVVAGGGGKLEVIKTPAAVAAWCCDLIMVWGHCNMPQVLPTGIEVQVTGAMVSTWNLGGFRGPILGPEALAWGQELLGCAQYWADSLAGHWIPRQSPSLTSLGGGGGCPWRPRPISSWVAPECHSYRKLLSLRDAPQAHTAVGCEAGWNVDLFHWGTGLCPVPGHK
jgi:hypothetical protein